VSGSLGSSLSTLIFSPDKYRELPFKDQALLWQWSEYTYDWIWIPWFAGRWPLVLMPSTLEASIRCWKSTTYIFSFNTWSISRIGSIGSSSGFCRRC